VAVGALHVATTMILERIIISAVSCQRIQILGPLACIVHNNSATLLVDILVASLMISLVSESVVDSLQLIRLKSN